MWYCKVNIRDSKLCALLSVVLNFRVLLPEGYRFSLPRRFGTKFETSNLFFFKPRRYLIIICQKLSTCRKIQAYSFLWAEQILLLQHNECARNPRNLNPAQNLQPRCAVILWMYLIIVINNYLLKNSWNLNLSVAEDKIINRLNPENSQKFISSTSSGIKL